MSESPRLFELFLDVQRGLPRQGPGADESTLHALSSCRELPEAADVLDVGCGPGMQTVALARAIDGEVAALDIHREYLTQLESRAEVAGIADRIAILAGDMNAPTEVAEYFGNEYPAMAHVEEILTTLRACGYASQGHFTLPDSAWWEHYYTPLRAKLPALAGLGPGTGRSWAGLIRRTRPSSATGREDRRRRP